MAYRNFWTMCAAASASVVVAGTTAPTALAQQQVTTIIGERAIEERRSVSVPYRDLDLTTRVGERRLHYRARTAARQVCQPNDDWLASRPYSKCLTFAWNGVLPQIDLAVQRAREIARRGTSSIPMVAIAIGSTR